MKRYTYIAAPRCLFVSAVEFDLIEMNQTPEFRAKYAQRGWPRVELEDGFSYAYMPVKINSKSYRLIAAPRPHE